MKSKSPIIPQRVRRITGSFSWLDHRLLHLGFLHRMQPEEMLLYFFLVLVGDRNGVSFYSYDTICTILKLTAEQLIHARNRLIDMSLIAFQDSRYQVLELPDETKTPEPSHCYQPPPHSHQTLSMREVLEKALQHNNR